MPYFAIDDVRMPHGWAMQSQETLKLLFQLFDQEGDHVEIGTGWGGTAILAAVARQGRGHIYAIDPITELGFYGDVEPMSGIRPTAAMLQENFHTYGLQDEITHIDARSHPWPLPPEQRFTTALIDGDHSYEGAWQDWLNIKDKVDGLVVFHDTWDPAFTGVTRAFTDACRDPHWLVYMAVYNIGVLKRLS